MKPYLKVEVGLGKSQVTLSWVPSTGRLAVQVDGGTSAFQVAKVFPGCQGKNLDEVLDKIGDLLSGVVDGDVLGALTSLVKKMADFNAKPAGETSS